MLRRTREEFGKDMAFAAGCVVVMILLAWSLAGCWWMKGGKTWTEMTPKEKSSYFMAVYNGQYQDTMLMATDPTITDAQKKVVRVKKSVLMKLWPAVQAYDRIAVHGGIPPVADEQKILEYINSLATAGSGG